MAGRRRRRPCRYCGRLFLPDARVKGQKACGTPECATKRADEAREKWRGKPANRSYFCERYEYVKSWLQKPENHGYLDRYRRSQRQKAAAARTQPGQAPSRDIPGLRPDDVARKWPDIQDESPVEIGSGTGPEATITS